MCQSNTPASAVQPTRNRSDPIRVSGEFHGRAVLSFWGELVVSAAFAAEAPDDAETAVVVSSEVVSVSSPLADAPAVSDEGISVGDAEPAGGRSAAVVVVTAFLVVVEARVMVVAWETSVEEYPGWFSDREAAPDSSSTRANSIRARGFCPPVGVTPLGSVGLFSTNSRFPSAESAIGLL